MIRIPFKIAPAAMTFVAFVLATTFVISSTAATEESAADAADERRPNIVLIFCDDLGYADISCFGAKGYETPNLDKLASEGMKFTDFQVAAAVCSASRAALLTGCYPQRVGILSALGPSDSIGIAKNELLISELLQNLGYKTACFGKWHLGHHEQFLPQQNGFATYFGLPYSNDMWPKHPTAKNAYPPLPLIDGNKTIELNPDQTKLTTWYTEKAVKFIHDCGEKPFFLYVPHNMPHVPLFVSEKFAGKTKRGLFGDVIAEIDWSVGEIAKALEATGNVDNTLVIFTSDNGPWLSYGDHAGSTGGFREGKGTVWEGGHRVPMIAKYPGTIQPGTTCDKLASTIDLFPTIAHYCGATIDPSRKIDGVSIQPLLESVEGAKSSHEFFYYYWGNGLEAVRDERFKLHFPHAFRSLTGTPGTDGMPNGYTQAKTELALFDLDADPFEQTNIAADHPEVTARLTAAAESMRSDLGDSLTGKKGTGIRPPDRFTQPKAN